METKMGIDARISREEGKIRYSGLTCARREMDLPECRGYLLSGWTGPF